MSSASCGRCCRCSPSGSSPPIPTIHAAIKLRTWTLWAASALYTAATIVLWSATTTVTSGPAEPVEQPDPPIWTFFLLLGLMAVRDVDLARELRIGRPDLPRQFDDGGLVDLDHVPAPVIIQLLGLSEAEAVQVIGARDRIGGIPQRRGGHRPHLSRPHAAAAPV